ncbi:hypothetical protein [Xanthomonas theicola]|uniref:hypothetical protein n=1 Tax=Xanthomonas theicola TaxID=56464 RepID=UPI0026CC3675
MKPTLPVVASLLLALAACDTSPAPAGDHALPPPALDQLDTDVPPAQALAAALPP